ncbi:hypothetical protein BS329_09785 [Amycolatopsis coloradensis]|uniref:Cell wall hydrolase n=1 Tax=Amycolatopsis coloradensis TaxID=76021 RepID=A0A1R0KVZ0_9PSEU|nr:hypothetical protein [Amycolatopsis coloradensis]OLZ53113.1 hypothetical protein BS329_09785 [Amycolatopsis coloradensis]
MATLATALTTAAVAALTMTPTATADTSAPAAVVSAAQARAALSHASLIRSGNDPIVFTKANGLGTMDVITCTAATDYPHNSAGTPSAVTGKSRSSCTAPVAQIRAQAELWRYLEGYGFSQTGIGSLAVDFKVAGPLTSTAYDICQGRLAYWKTIGRHTFYAPPGYSPPSLSFKTETPPVGVNC